MEHEEPVIDRLIPPAEMRNHEADDYLQQTAKDMDTIRRLVPLQPSARVLDVGCSAGRLSLPLLNFLDPAAGGSYEGFDVKPDRVAWATEHITSQWPNFRFRHLDVHSGALNPSGSIDGATLTFPYESSAFDLVIFYSVFTHLLPPEARRYLAETRRCLAPQGRVFSTWYLWDADTARSVAEHDVAWTFPFEQDGYRLQYPDYPESAVAFNYLELLDELGAVDLMIEEWVPGNWRRARLGAQDILILQPDSRGSLPGDGGSTAPANQTEDESAADR